MVLLCPRDAGRELGVSVSRVVQLCREGLLKEIRDSAGRRLFRPQDVRMLARARDATRRARERSA